MSVIRLLYFLCVLKFIFYSQITRYWNGTSLEYLLSVHMCLFSSIFQQNIMKNLTEFSLRASSHVSPIVSSVVHFWTERKSVYVCRCACKNVMEETTMEFVIELHLSKLLIDRFYYHRHRRQTDETLNPFSSLCFTAKIRACRCRAHVSIRLCQFWFIFAANFSAFVRIFHSFLTVRECQSKHSN